MPTDSEKQEAQLTMEGHLEKHQGTSGGGGSKEQTGARVFLMVSTGRSRSGRESRFRIG